MTLKTRIFFGFLILIFWITYAIFLWYYQSSIPQSLVVDVEDRLNINKVKVELNSWHYIPKATLLADSILVQKGQGKIIFENGKSKKFELENVDKNIHVVYDDKYYFNLPQALGKMSQDKIVQQYHLHLYKQNGQIYASLQRKKYKLYSFYVGLQDIDYYWTKFQSEKNPPF